MIKSEHGHRFRIGQIVSLIPAFSLSRNLPAWFEVVALLPPNGGSYFQYRIRNGDELFERVAAENELMLRRQQ